MMKILTSLVSLGLVMEIEAGYRRDMRTTKTYRITQKGVDVLQYFSGAKELLSLEEIA